MPLYGRFLSSIFMGGRSHCVFGRFTLPHCPIPVEKIDTQQSYRSHGSCIPYPLYTLRVDGFSKGSFLNNPYDYLGLLPFVANPKSKCYFGVRPKIIMPAKAVPIDTFVRNEDTEISEKLPQILFEAVSIRVPIFYSSNETNSQTNTFSRSLPRVFPRGSNNTISIGRLNSDNSTGYFPAHQCSFWYAPVVHEAFSFLFSFLPQYHLLIVSL